MIFSRWESKVWHDLFTPLSIVNWLAGLGAYRPPNKSEFWYTCSWISTVLVNFSQWFLIFYGIRNILSSLRANFGDSTSPLLFKIVAAIAISNSLIALIYPVLMWLQRKRIMECYNQIPILDVKFRAIFGAKNEHGKQYFYMLFNIFGIFVITTISIARDSYAIWCRTEDIFYIICFNSIVHRPILIMLLVNLNFCTFVGYLEKKFRDLNEGLLQMAKPKPSNYSPGNVLLSFFKSVQQSRVGRKMENNGPELLTNDYNYLLQETRKAHLELSKMSRKINDAFGVQNLISLSVSFGVITGVFYVSYIYSRVISASSWTDYTDVLRSTPMLWTVSYLFTILKINFACGAAVKESLRTGQIVCELMTTTELEEEIEEFSIQMIQNPVRFDACGFFALDYSFVQGVIGSITTYMVILIQLSPGPDPTSTHRLSNLWGNLTEGMGALRQPYQGTGKYYVMCLYMLFINVGNIVLIYFGVSWIFRNTGPLEIMSVAARIGTIMTDFLSITNAFHTVIAPILVCLQRKTILDYFKQLPVLDVKFQTLFGVDIHDEYRKRFIHLSLKIIIAMTLFLAVALAEFILIAECILEMSIVTVAIMMNVFQPMSVMFTLSCNFYVILGYLEKKFQDLNIGLMKLSVQIDPAKEESETVNIMAEKLQRLKEIRKIHMQLHELSKGVNVGFGIQNILTAGSSFAIITGLLYCTYLGVTADLSFSNRRVVVMLVPAITWIIIYALRIWILAHSCWRVIESAKKTGHVIYELLILNYDEHFQNEIHEFSLQMLQNPVKFDACGFFTMDHTFVQGVLGTVTTHLVILIQMSASALNVSCHN